MAISWGDVICVVTFLTSDYPSDARNVLIIETMVMMVSLEEVGLRLRRFGSFLARRTGTLARFGSGIG